MKFQGQWMSIDNSGSFFPRVVCTGEVKTCSRSSCHGTDRKAPACSVPPSCTVPVPQHGLSSPHSSTARSLHTRRCFAREMSQQPARRRKSASKGGHQTQQSQRLHGPSKACGELVGSAQHSFFFLGGRTGHARTPGSGEGGCTGSQDMVLQSNAEAKRVNSQVSRTSSYYFWCHLEAVVISIYCKLLHEDITQHLWLNQQDLDFSSLCYRKY